MHIFAFLSSSEGDTGIDEKDFRKIFDLYFDDVRRFLLYKSKDMELSEDIAQDTFVNLWKKRTEIRKATVKTLLFTIANNLLMNSFNRSKRHISFVNQAEDRYDNENPEFLLEEKEFKERLEQAINDLPEASRVVFIMSRIDGKKYSEISEMLGVGVKAVEKRMSKALRILREEFDV